MSTTKKPDFRRTLQMTAAAALVTAALYPAAEAGAVEQVQRYCSASWRNAGISDGEWDDCTQHAIASLLERVPRSSLVTAVNQRESEERRELNRAIWRTTQRWRRARRHTSLDALEAYEPSAQVESDHEQELQRMRDAVGRCLHVLNPTQQEIIRRTSDGASVSDIAAAMDLPAARISDQKYKAIKKLRDYVQA